MITLSNNFRIEFDTYSVNLIYEKEGDINEETGKPIITKKTYFCSNLTRALLMYMDKCIAVDNPDTFEEVINKLDEVANTINNLKINYDKTV